MTQRTRYRPPAHKLLDTALEHLNLPNDRALARLIEVSPSILSKIRSRRIGARDGLLIRLHEETGLTIRALKQLRLESDQGSTASHAAVLAGLSAAGLVPGGAKDGRAAMQRVV